MKNLVSRFVSDESGATAIEYGLIAAGISVAIIAVVQWHRFEAEYCLRQDQYAARRTIIVRNRVSKRLRRNPPEPFSFWTPRVIRMKEKIAKKFSRKMELFFLRNFQPPALGSRMTGRSRSRVIRRIKKMSLLNKFLRDESGATAIEYGLIAAGISVAIIAWSTASARSSILLSARSIRSWADIIRSDLSIQRTPRDQLRNRAASFFFCANGTARLFFYCSAHVPVRTCVSYMTMALTDAIRLLLFPALMAFAASSDLFTMTISNRVSLALIAGFAFMAVAHRNERP